MLNISNTLNELKAIVNQIKTKQDSHTAWTGTEKVDLEKRLAHLYDKSNPRHTNLTADLDFDLKDLESIDKTIGQQKLTTDAEIKKLTDERNQLQTDLTAKDNLLKDKDQAIGSKITKDLIDKLEKVSKLSLEKLPKKDKDGNDLKDSQGNIIYEELIDLSKLNEIKTLVDELKTKGITTDLTSTNSKIEEVKNKVENINPPKDYWSIAACAGGIISVLLLTYLAFFKPNKSSSSRIKSEVEED